MSFLRGLPRIVKFFGVLALLVILLLFALGLLVGASMAPSRLKSPKFVAAILEIPGLPASATKIDCLDHGVTDFLASCFFEIEPRDFPKLLEGREFEAYVPDFKSSHDFQGGPPVGPKFSIGTAYSAMPSDAPHGGSLRVATDRFRHYVVVDIYVE